MSKADFLLDINVLMAIGWTENEDYQRTHSFLTNYVEIWATCAITELGFVRVSSISSVLSQQLTPYQVHQNLQRLCSDPQHRYLENLPTFRHCDISKLQGHKQLTDFYLVKLAEYYGMRLLTLDKRLVNSLPSNSSILLLPE